MTTEIRITKNTKLISAILAGFVITSLALFSPLALAKGGSGNSGRGGGDNSGRGNSGPGNAASIGLRGINSGPGSVVQAQVRDDDDDINDIDLNDLDLDEDINDLDLDEDIDELNDIRRARGVDEPRVRLALNGRAEIRGATISSLNAGNKTLVVSVFGVQVSVNAANALLLDRDERPITFADLKVGDSLRIQGTVSASTTTSTVPTSVNADRIINRSIELAEIAPVVPPNFLEQRIRELQEIIARLQQEIARLLGGVADTTPPVISAVTVSGVTSSGAVVSWTTNEPANSKVFVSTSTPVNLATAVTFTDNTRVTGHSVSLTGLAAGTVFFAVAESTDAAGNTTRSGQVSFTTSAAGDVTAPIVSAVSVSGITSSSASIAWTTNEPANSRIFFSTSTPINLATASVVSDAAMVTSHSMTLTGLAASTTFFAVIESADAAGNVFRTDELTFTTSASPVADTTPPVISGITVTGITSAGATINWTTNESTTGRAFFSATTPVNPATAPFLSDNIVGTSHTMTVTGIAASTTEFFVIEARDAAGNIALAAEQSFITLP